MSGNIGTGYALDDSVVERNFDGNARAGTLACVDFSRAECMVSGAPKNLAAVIATDLVGDACHPLFAGKLANITAVTDGAVGFGAERARLHFPTALTDYCVGKNIGFSLWFRLMNGPASPWRAGAAVSLGAKIWHGAIIYTVTDDGVLGSSAPVHSTGAATNGTAQLTAGVPYNATPSYGQNYPGPLLFLDQNTDYPAEYELATVATTNGYLSTPLNDQDGPIKMGQINHAAFDGDNNALNGVFKNPPDGRGVAVEATPTTRRITFGADIWSDPRLYNATTGEAVANTAGLYAWLYRLVIEDLDVSNRTLEDFTGEERRLMRAYHPSRALLA